MVNAMNQMIDTVLADFNFNKVRNYMQLAGWTWGSDPHIPSTEELEAQARELLKTVLESPLDNSMCACGGFHAHKWTWAEGKVELELLFALEEEHRIFPK